MSSRRRRAALTPCGSRSEIISTIEQLEDRTLLAVGSMFIQATGTLVVVSDAADDIAVTAAAGQVLVNGASPQTGPLDSLQVEAISITGGQGGNDIDLAGVTTADFTALAGSAIEVAGGDGADTITASPLGGFYEGGHGNDLLNGSAGDDTLDGDDGHDTLNGMAGDDLLIGEDGNDSLAGFAGNDTLDGGDGADSLDGGDGDDSITGGDDSDTLDGGTGNDLLNGGFSNDTVDGGDGDDTLFGGANDDSLSGGDGNDRLTGNAGADTLDGGAGNDTLKGTNGENVLSGGGGDDDITGGTDGDTINGGDGADTLDGATGDDSINGDGGADSLLGGPGEDTLFGGDGDDTIVGQGDDDTLIGGLGADSMDGGVGNDLIQSEVPSISIDDVIFDPEGDVGTGDAIFTVTLSQAGATVITVDFSTAEGTATADVDYASVSGTLTFAPGVTSQTVTVPVIGDLLPEMDETFFVDLANPIGSVLGDGQGMGTIIDDDFVAMPMITIDDVTIDPEGDPGMITFSEIGDFAANSQPFRVEAADMDGDGDIDLVVADRDFVGNGAASLLLNNGDGTFAAPTIIAAVTEAYDVAVADFDADGDNDVAVTDRVDNDVTIAINDGTGMFTVTATIAAPGNTHEVEALDIDGDGDQDLAVVGRNQSEIIIYSNDGAGTFTAGAPLAIGTPTAVGLAQGDFDGDGDIDLVTSHVTTADAVVLLTNDGTGALTPGAPVPAGDDPGQIAVGDIDNDGDLDLATADRAGGTATILINDGTGLFAVGSMVAGGTQTDGVSFADFDGDGNLDLAVVDDSTAGPVFVYSGDGTGTFANPMTVTTADRPRVATPFDADGDGDADLAVAIFNDDTVRILENETLAGLTDAVFTVSLDMASAATVTVDFATSDGTATGGPAVAPGVDYFSVNGTLTFPPGVTTQTVMVQVVGDLDPEPDENFLVDLSNPTNAMIADNQGMGTIIDDDTVVPGTLYGMGPFDGVVGPAMLFTLDVATGAPTIIGPTNLNGLIGLTDDAAGTIYTVAQGGDTERTLYTLDPMTGAISTLFGLGTMAGLGEGSLAFDDANNQIYVLSRFMTTLFRIDIGPQTLTNLGTLTFGGQAIGLGNIDGMDFRNGVLYGVVASAGNTPAIDDHLVIIDPVNLTVTDVGALGQNVPGVAGLAYDSDNDVFYANTMAGDLVSIDPTTGAATIIGPHMQQQIAGLTFVPGSGTTPPVSSRLFGSPNDTSNMILEFDPATGAVINSFASPVPTGFGWGMAYDGTRDSLFALVAGSNMMFELDPNSGAVIDSDSVGTQGSNALAALNGLIYILESNADDIAVYDPNTDTVTNTLDIDSLNPGVVTDLNAALAGIANPDRLVVMDVVGNNRDIHEIDPATGLVTSTFTAANTPNSGGAAVVNGEIFLARTNLPMAEVYARNGNFVGTVTFSGLTGTGVTALAGDESSGAGNLAGLANIGGPEDDTLLGGDGNDTLLAGPNDDSLNGGAGDDSLSGGAGNDIIEGAAGRDTLTGGDGDDLLDGGRGSDTVSGDGGNDTIAWEAFDGSDQVDGGLGFDELDVRTKAHNDRITVSAVGDGRFQVHHRIPSDAVGQTIRGGMIEDLVIDSNGGADRITVEDLTGVTWLQQVTIDAGRGSDLVDASAQANADILISVMGGTGADTVVGGAGDDVIDGNEGNDLIEGGGGADTINGSAGVDKLFGGDSDDVLSGGDGRDFIRGEDGDDVLSGGNQNDDLFGGTGNDLLLGDAGDDSLLGEQGDDTADGGDGNDTVDGGDGDDVLDGSAGVDSLRGGDGNDTARGGADGDTIAGGAGDDSLLGGNGSIVLLTDGNDFINGNSGNDTLLGENGQDSLLGGAGHDDLDGGFGNDQVNGNAGHDTMRGGHGNDRLRGGMGNDTLNGGHGEDKLFGQAGDDGLSGHDGHDRLNGGGGADTLHGGDGNDTLRGGAGVDLLIGHDGNDNLNGQGGDPDTLVGQDAFDILDDNGGLDVKDNDFVFFADWIDAA